MRRLVLMSMLIICLVFSSAGVNAALFNLPGDALVLDSDTGQYWIQDLSAFSSGTYDQQIFAINVLNQISFNGISDWHMATQSEMDDLWSYIPEDIAYHFSPSYPITPSPSNTSDIGIDGRYDEDMSIPGILDDYHGRRWISYAYWGTPPHYAGNTTLESDMSTEAMLGAWVVSGSPVLLPPSLLFMVSGLIGCIGIKRWFRR